MATYYMTGTTTTTCRSPYNAHLNVERYGKPAVIRKEGDFYIVTRLQSEPVQPGQFPFKLQDGEEVYFS